jgi:hypothetical protein
MLNIDAGLGGDLFAHQNKDSSGECHKVQKENERPEVQTESQKAIDNEIDPEQHHANILSEFHAAVFLIAIAGDNPKMPGRS